MTDVAPSELAQRKVREVLRPSLEPLEWKELAALIAKGWDREAESRPSARAMYEELCTLNGMPDPNVEVSPMRSVGMWVLEWEGGGVWAVGCRVGNVWVCVVKGAA